MKQGSLFKSKRRTAHGGDLNLGRRKLERPFARNKWIHLVLKSDKARGRLSLISRRNRDFVQRLIYTKGRAFGVQVADYANAGDHLHVKIRTATRAQMRRFLRSITGRIARFVTGARKGRPFGRFWRHLAYTRVLSSRREEVHLRGYLEANRIEVEEGYQAREEFLEDFKRARAAPG